jgi:hypothetical protein
VNLSILDKTKTDVKMFFEWLQQFGVGEQRDFHKILGSEMDSLLTRFCLSVAVVASPDYLSASLLGSSYM